MLDHSAGEYWWASVLSSSLALPFRQLPLIDFPFCAVKSDIIHHLSGSEVLCYANGRAWEAWESLWGADEMQIHDELSSTSTTASFYDKWLWSTRNEFSRHYIRHPAPRPERSVLCTTVKRDSFTCEINFMAENRMKWNWDEKLATVKFFASRFAVTTCRLSSSHD